MPASLRSDFIHIVGMLHSHRRNTHRELLEALHEQLAPAGYQINDGGGGEILWHMATGVLTHESYSLCTECSYNAAEEY
ncbi:MAG: hypothetical protein ACRD4Q_12160 [Candidatus Acidiferrales bacterium]